MHAYCLIFHPIRTLLMFHCLSTNFAKKKSGTNETYCCCSKLFIYLIFFCFQNAGEREIKQKCLSLPQNAGELAFLGAK